MNPGIINPAGPIDDEVPAVCFVQLGLDLKLDSSFAQTTVAERSNGAAGSFPKRRAYPHDNCEVGSARCTGGSGEMLALAAVDLLKGPASHGRWRIPVMNRHDQGHQTGITAAPEFAVFGR
jgi:hypothetical protein